MDFSSRIKPLSYVQTHVSDIIDSLSDKEEPLIITQDGEAKAVLLDYETYARTHETLVLLKILALGNKQIETGQVIPVKQAVERIIKQQESV